VGKHEISRFSRKVSRVHARGLWPRGSRRQLALALPSVLPSALSRASTRPIESYFAAQYPACTCPCLRFVIALTDAHARLGAGVGR